MASDSNRDKGIFINLSSCTPTRLIEAAETIARTHKRHSKNDETLSAASGPDNFDELLKKIKRGGRNELVKIAFALTRREALFLLTALKNEDDSFCDKVLAIVGLRRQIFKFSLFWNALVLSPENKNLYSLTIATTSAGGDQKRPGTEGINMVEAERFFIKSQPASFIDGLFILYQNKKYILSNFCAYYSIHKDGFLHGLMIKKIMTGYEPEFGRLEGDIQIFSYLTKHLSKEEAIQFAGKYFSQTPDDAWNELILNYFFHLLGTPSNMDNWNFVTGPVLKKLQNRYSIAEIRKFFDKLDKDNVRFNFWQKNYGQRFTNAYKFSQINAILMYIENIAILEFANIGNACYVYKAEFADLLIRKFYNSSYESKLKYPEQ
ncbi:MAG TPA: hypothetical protein PKL57_14165, partial [Candidatus Wallbacteria bacterium]|nr:hypothetical protein [Candidatus Wallbacteria bacterium]